MSQAPECFCLSSRIAGCSNQVCRPQGDAENGHDDFCHGSRVQAMDTFASVDADVLWRIFNFVLLVRWPALDGDANELHQLQSTLRHLRSRCPAIARTCRLAARLLREHHVTFRRLQQLLRQAVAVRFQRLVDEAAPRPDGVYGLSPHALRLPRRPGFRFELRSDLESQRPWMEPLAAVSLELVPILAREMLVHDGCGRVPAFHGLLSPPERRREWSAMLGKPCRLDISRLLYGRRHSCFPFIEISAGAMHDEGLLPICDLLDAMSSPRVASFEELLDDSGLAETNILITLGEADNAVHPQVYTDWGAFPGAGMAILRFFGEGGREVCLECLVSGFDHSKTRLSWGEGPNSTLMRGVLHAWGFENLEHSHATLGRIDPDDRPCYVPDFIALPEAVTSFAHAMELAIRS